MQQTTFENIVTEEEIAQNEQFLLLQQRFQLYSVKIPSFIVIFYIFENSICPKRSPTSSAADMLYVGKG